MQAAGSGKGLMEDEKNMKEPYESTIVIAAKADVAEKMESILLRAGIRIDAVCHSGEEAIACMHGREVLFLTTYQLPDMSGMELARRAGDMCGVVMIVPQDYVESDDDYETVHIMRNPVSRRRWRRLSARCCFAQAVCSRWCRKSISSKGCWRSARSSSAPRAG
ncbi:MAG: response regulator [Clostridia bacterium]|nr:response regulator [Clostridia bacterium]